MMPIQTTTMPVKKNDMHYMSCSAYFINLEFVFSPSETYLYADVLMVSGIFI